MKGAVVYFLHFSQNGKKKFKLMSKKMIKANKMNNEKSDKGKHAFRSCEKEVRRYYKQKEALPDFVLDFEKEEYMKDVEWKRELKEGTVLYSIKDAEGLLFIKNLWSVDEQIKWSTQSLKRFIEPPNKTNLTPYYLKEDLENLLDKSIEYVKNTDKITLKKEKLSNKMTPVKLLDALRFSTLGYQYDWTRRVYPPEDYVPFPENLGDEVKRISKECGFQHYTPEAAIVNFYKSNSKLCGHYDDAEFYYGKKQVRKHSTLNRFSFLVKIKKVQSFPYLWD